MGQKVNPHGLRVGIIKDWDSKWYASDDKFADYLAEDHKIREFLKRKLYAAGVSKIEIERASDRVKVVVYTAKPGIVIGKGGAEIEKIKDELKPERKKRKKPAKPENARSAEIEAVERELMSLTGTKVRIAGDASTGRIEMDYYSLDELNRLIETLREAFGQRG